MPKELFWVHEVGDMLGLCPKSVRNLANQGKIDCLRDSKGRRRFTLEAVNGAKQRLGLNMEAPTQELTVDR